VQRRNLAEEAIWLGRLVASLLPEEPEALGLLSLMLHAHARRGARRDADGHYVPLAEQDTTLWDAAMIDDAEALLMRAGTLGALGRYQLEAAIQSAHVVRRRSGDADWAAIERLYDALLALTASPVVAINRAIAIAQTRGAAAALHELDLIADDPRLAQYQPYWAARAELLGRIGDVQAAVRACDQAIGLESDPAVALLPTAASRQAGANHPQAWVLTALALLPNKVYKKPYVGPIAYLTGGDTCAEGFIGCCLTWRVPVKPWMTCCSRASPNSTCISWHGKTPT
jgi:predicted RNA polymerase sigma factor